MSLNLILVIVAVGGFLTLTLLGYLLMMPQMQARGRFKQRMAFAAGGGARGVALPENASRSGGNKKRNIQARLRELEQDKKQTESRIARYRKDLRQTGLDISLQKFFIGCAVLAVVSSALYLLKGYPWWGTPLVAIAVGFGVPRWLVGFMVRRRQKQFTQQFANAVDVIVRGIRSGLPVGECLNVIARESPEPVGGVFREIVEGQRLGLTLEETLDRAIEQMPTPELKFFAIVLSIQRQTGGNLAETLANLSTILRDRKKMGDKVKALSSEARSSAMIIGSLPILVGLLLYFVSPEYMEIMFTDYRGQFALGGGATWMMIGVFVMKTMIDFEI